MIYTEEIWKDIVGYEGLYQISNYGNVKSFKERKEGKLLSPNKDKDGYLQIGLRDRAFHRKWFRIHRLVANAFIPNPQNLSELNHIDHVKHNNYVDNIEWCTISYNNKYRFKDGHTSFVFGENRWNASITNETALKIFELGNSGQYTEPQLAKMFNTTRRVVSGIRLGYAWSKVTGKVKKV